MKHASQNKGKKKISGKIKKKKEKESTIKMHLKKL